jgi:hypothetical protein
MVSFCDKCDELSDSTQFRKFLIRVATTIYLRCSSRHENRLIQSSTSHVNSKFDRTMLATCSTNFVAHNRSQYSHVHSDSISLEVYTAVTVTLVFF